MHADAALKALFLVVFTLLPIINPIGLAPIYLQMKTGWPQDARNAMARRIGGGLLVASSGWRLLRSDDTPR